VTLTQDTGH